jgi:hypothetical protein
VTRSLGDELRATGELYAELSAQAEVLARGHEQTVLLMALRKSIEASPDPAAATRSCVEFLQTEAEFDRILR